MTDADPTQAQDDGWIRWTFRGARRMVIAVVGGTIVSIGIAMLVLPGPALVVIPAGLGILGLEFAWARRWLRRVRDQAEYALANTIGRGRVRVANSAPPAVDPKGSNAARDGGEEGTPSSGSDR